MKFIVRLQIISVIIFLVFPLWPVEKKSDAYLKLALEAEKWIRSAAIPLAVGNTWHPHPDAQGYSGDNLDFEKEIKERDRTSWSGQQKNGDFGCDRTIFRSGKQSGFLKNDTNNSTSSLYQILYQGLNTDRKASLNGYLKTAGLKGVVRITLYAFGGSIPAKMKTYFHFPKTSQAEWNRFQLEVEVPKGCDLVFIHMSLKGEGLVWFDDFSLNFTMSDIKSPGEFIPAYTTLYSGTPGIILFYLELYKMTGNRDFLSQATSGGQYLVSHIQKNKKLEYGLYIGTGGVLFTLERLYTATGDQQFKLAINNVLSRIARMADKEKPVIIYPIAEILYGGSGDGLALLHLHRELKLPGAKDMAVKIGNGLVDSTLEKMKSMPNFSHGISGVGYFLSCLHQVSGDERFLKKAQEIAVYLEEISEENCLIYHDTDRKGLFYLGYCHGPAGTARFFFRLWQITREKKWLNRVHRSAQSIIQAGIPNHYTPGYWNNLGQCCGHAGVAEFFLGLYQISKNKDYLKFVKILTRDLISKSVQTATGGTKWVHAEHNRQREFTMAQTGLMQGSAGIGLWLLHLEAFEKSRKPFIIMPDFPFYE